MTGTADRIGVLVDAGAPRYVDWEWVEIGDPAQDLAYIGGPSRLRRGTCRSAWSASTAS